MKRPAKRELQAFGWRTFGFAFAAIALGAVVAILGFKASDTAHDSPVPRRPAQSPGGDASPPASAGQQPGSGDPELTGQSPQDREPADKGPDDVAGDGQDQEEGVPPAAQAGPPPSIATPGNGKPADTPAAEAPGLVGDLTSGLGGAIDDIGEGVDKALCPPVDRAVGLCSD